MLKISQPFALALALSCAAVLPVQAAEPTPAESGVRGGEAAVERSVIEDDQNRIESLKVRGQTVRITVQSKVPGAKAYDITVPDTTGRAAEADPKAGKRVWWALNF
ncbi:hypothetical protein [Ideonella paludis]|uniref:DUF2782 domain-containing protein n=1 Tax=Ideonella paludis TaxID=1233411 RepID=A0ABS5E0R2_9BURK|nr:hypothetical protein [Ideonella paludis]MBQ0937001.1 hypothetical protein [Ideonella paludis]